MIQKLLIANRGEIACRIIATARRMGIDTVAVYSDADASARHVAMADQAIHIGPAPVADSYLQGARIVEAALATGADAIHPGYGFLSENPDFVDRITDAGLIFVGPPASAIRAMGLKDAAKALMETAGVPVVPGYHGQDQDPDVLSQQADAIGYPVMIKARAGGGGKGMRQVENPSDFHTALASARREAETAFGDPACLIEKFIQQPRHIEIQVFADNHGNVVHLFERDCSLQRRHQKVIEEAPAPGMTDAMRAAMGKAAVEAARSIGYVGAGTVEFIVDGRDGLHTDKFWFMEMNTRLQVEHPVSEAITGLDFVDLQLRISAGDPLPFAQSDLRIDGHAFEARIYAEDAAAGFLPATGTVGHWVFPHAAEFARGDVRVDSGIRNGDKISPHYDPMIAKLIVHGPDRDAALRRLRRALADCRIGGTVTNIGFLSALARHDSFSKGDVDTGLIARHQDSLIATAEPDTSLTAIAAITALDLLEEPARGSPWTALRGFAAWGPRDSFVTFADVGTCRVTALNRRRFVVSTHDTTTEVALVATDRDRVTVQTGTNQFDCHAIKLANTVTVFSAGQTHTWTMPDPLVGEEASADLGDSITAPMPGLVKVIHATAGDSLSKGDPVLVLEAMKMEHSLAAPRDGHLSEIFVREGQQVVGGAILAKMAEQA